MSANCDSSISGQIDVEEDISIEEPPRYQVLMHDDDTTTMEFVIFVLQRVFHKSFEEARALMLRVHNQGVGNCGVFTQEIAKTKVAHTRQEARQAGYPLRCTIEKV